MANILLCLGIVLGVWLLPLATVIALFSLVTRFMGDLEHDEPDNQITTTQLFRGSRDW